MFVRACAHTNTLSFLFRFLFRFFTGIYFIGLCLHSFVRAQKLSPPPHTHPTHPICLSLLRAFVRAQLRLFVCSLFFYCLIDFSFSLHPCFHVRMQMQQCFLILYWLFFYVIASLFSLSCVSSCARYLKYVFFIVRFKFTHSLSHTHTLTIRRQGGRLPSGVNYPSPKMQCTVIFPACFFLCACVWERASALSCVSVCLNVFVFSFLYHYYYYLFIR